MICFHGEPIIDEARSIAAQATRGVHRDNGRYLEYDEDLDVYWAIDTKYVLDDLEKPIDENDIGWLNAVEECRECGTFFVKERRDQIFDTNQASRPARLKRFADPARSELRHFGLRELLSPVSGGGDSVYGQWIAVNSRRLLGGLRGQNVDRYRHWRYVWHR